MLFLFSRLDMEPFLWQNLSLWDLKKHVPLTPLARLGCRILTEVGCLFFCFASFQHTETLYNGCVVVVVVGKHQFFGFKHLWALKSPWRFLFLATSI